MNKRPISVTVLGVLLAAAGAVGFVYHLSEFKSLRPLPWDLLLISVVRIVAIVSGVYMLRGRNWARWIAIAWLAFHVGVSAFHSTAEVAMHALLLAVFTWLLFRPAASKYFHRQAAV